MSDIVERLRNHVRSRMPGSEPVLPNGAWNMMLEAADEIERLRNAIYEVTTNGRWTEGEQRGEWAISTEVYETARDAYGKDVCDEQHQRD